MFCCPLPSNVCLDGFVLNVRDDLSIFVLQSSPLRPNSLFSARSEGQSFYPTMEQWNNLLQGRTLSKYINLHNFNLGVLFMSGNLWCGVKTQACVMRLVLQVL